MTNEQRVISTALCVYRRERETEFFKQHGLMQAAEKGSDKHLIAADKMLNAGYECHDAHDALKTGSSNPCDVWDRELLDMMRQALGDRPAEAYARAEARMEDQALAKFHYDAFGED